MDEMFTLRIELFKRFEAGRILIGGEPIELKKNHSSKCNKYMLFTGWEVRIGKNCARGLEYGPRAQFFPIRTDLSR